jgi:hypothetical protein
MAHLPVHPGRRCFIPKQLNSGNDRHIHRSYCRRLPTCPRKVTCLEASSVIKEVVSPRVQAAPSTAAGSPLENYFDIYLEASDGSVQSVELFLSENSQIAGLM